MSGILVNFATVSQASSDVKATAGRIKSQLDELESMVKRVANTWEGAAQEGYQQKQRQWDQTADNLHQVLLKIATALQNSADNYQSTEKPTPTVGGCPTGYARTRSGPARRPAGPLPSVDGASALSGMAMPVWDRSPRGRNTMSMGITGFTGRVPRVGVSRQRPRGTRCAQRAFGVLAALGLCVITAATPAAAAPAPGAGLDSSSECKFGGDNLKSKPWSLQRVLLDELWSKATGKDVTVAVIDTGVDKDNRQIRPALMSGGRDFVGKTQGTQDINGHGTRVAGIIAARKMAGTGFSGIAPRAKILPLRYTGSDDPKKQGNSTTMSDAIKYAVSKGVDIINISSDTVGKKPNSQLQAAVQSAVSKDILVVAAAGNDGADDKLEKTYPAAYDGVVAVAASDRNNERAFFSQSGRFVDIAAPGVGMVSTVPNGGQCAADGTSFSAPYVSGVAALMKQKYPRWSAQQIAARLAQTANRPGSGPDTQLGWGVVDPVAALSGSDTPQNKPVADKQQKSGHVTPMSLTIGESDTERTQRISVYVMATGTVLTLLIGGASIAARDYRRKRARTTAATADGTTTSTRH
jgi:membrane-anchored mycosin MYCP